MKQIEPFKKGQYLRAADLNKISAEVSRQSHITALPPLEVQSNGSGTQIRFVDNFGFWAQLTEEDSGAFAWTEQVTAPNGTFEAKTNGRTGTTSENPAFEANDATGLDLPMYVWLRPGWQHSPGDGSDFTGQEYLFTADKGSFPAKLTAFGDDGDGFVAWSWTEQQPAVNGTWEDKPDGMTGVFDGSKPAYERNGFQGIPIDSVVWLHPGFQNADDPPGQEYEFGYEQDHFAARISADLGSGGYTVIEQDPPGSDLSGGRNVTAHECNLSVGLPIGGRVEVFQFGVGEEITYWFLMGNAPPIPAVLTAFCDDGSGRVAYSWEQVTPAAHGTWTVVGGGHSGVCDGDGPAYERNGMQAPVGSVVWLYRGHNQLEWVFDYECDHFSAELGAEVDVGVYEFTEQYPPGVDLTGGRTGEAAEYNGVSGIEEGTRVEVFVFGLLGGFEYWFVFSSVTLDVSGGSSIPPFPAIITGWTMVSGQPRYSWSQAKQVNYGFQTKPGGLSGTNNAFERNQFAFVPPNAVVWLYKGLVVGGVQTWIFDYEQDHFPALIHENLTGGEYIIFPCWPLPTEEFEMEDIPLTATEYNHNDAIPLSTVVNVFRYEDEDGGLNYYFYHYNLRVGGSNEGDPEYTPVSLIEFEGNSFELDEITDGVEVLPHWCETGETQPIGLDCSCGSSDHFARADHVHCEECDGYFDGTKTVVTAVTWDKVLCQLAVTTETWIFNCGRLVDE